MLQHYGILNWNKASWLEDLVVEVALHLQLYRHLHFHLHLPLHLEYHQLSTNAQAGT